MKKGKVKFYNEQKGYGFIIEDGGTEYFVHATGLIDQIRSDERVTFNVVAGKKGENAVDVKLES